MEKRSSSNRQQYAVVLAIIASFAFNCLQLFVLFYTNARVTQVVERISKFEGKLEVMEKTEVDNFKQNQPNVSVLQHRDKRSVSAVTLDRVSKRLAKLENRFNTSQNKKLENNKCPLSLLKGRDGRDGRDGKVGPPGPPGKLGPRGTPGKQGQKGRDGRDGRDGIVGPPGLPGKLGPRGTPGKQGQKGSSGANASGGVHYVRWGRTTCPSHAHVVYKGRMGGSHYSHTGGGSNYLCLANTPKYAVYQDGLQGRAYIYGAEYESNSFKGFSRNLQDHDAPCVVCYVPSRGSQLMYPARFDCPSGWTMEYWGYLMSEKYYHKHSTSFICVDQNAEYVPGTSYNHNGVLLYPVEGICGSLPCSPYVNGRELTCAVCSR